MNYIIQGDSSWIPFHVTLLKRYAPQCKWHSNHPLAHDIKYIVHAKPQHFLQGRPNEDALKYVFNVLDEYPHIQTVSLLPKFSSVHKGWFLTNEKGSNVWI